MPHELHAAGIAKVYPMAGTPLVVLEDLSFHLTSADGPAAILGPSGSGKSTLLHILGSLDVPTTGTLTIDGIQPLGMPPRDLARHRAARIGFVFQDHHLLPQLSALENVLVARLALGAVLAEHRQRAEALLRAVGLSDRLTHLPAELSGGQRQRVAIARALMNAPALLLCDEPTGDLDADTAQAVGDLLLEAARAQDALLIVATHATPLAARCARRWTLAKGRLVPAEGGPA